MARRTKEVTIAEANRDKGKTFLITEMPAVQAEKWAMRALLVLAASGIEIPEEAAQAGLAGLAAVGLWSFRSIAFADAEPLLDEMMECVQIREPAITRRLTPDDIEEVTTLLKLREEVLSLHLGFSLAEYRSKSTSAIPSAGQSSTATSSAQSEPSSPAA